jgi:predicted LPLAT superfamily acyltransferase
MLMRNPQNETAQDWLCRKERGTVPVMKSFVWLALHLGRPIARGIAYGACAYYIVASSRVRQDSRLYLARVLGRRPTFGDIFKHISAFAMVVLDRIYLLNDQIDLYDLTMHGEDVVTGILHKGQGCLLLGAHHGSFEVLRAVGRRQPNLKVAMVMFEENARKVSAALNIINPALAMDVISLGRSGSLLQVGQLLSQGQFVGILADRGLGDDGREPLSFLGSPAKFPTGPFRMAELLSQPVVLMFGLYRGGNRYDIHFELLAEATDCDPDSLMQRYVERLEHYCRIAPYNWFNFYDFWN